MTRKAFKIQFFFAVTLMIFICGFPQLSHAQTDNSAFQVTGYPVPRFVSLSSDKVFMRTGPGKKYPVLWEYRKRGLPVEIVMEFDVWRKIRDQDGEQGWVHKSLISGRRTAIINHDDLVRVQRYPEDDSRLMAYVEPKAILALDECTPVWCKIESQGYSGWVERKYLWGIYENETIN